MAFKCENFTRFVGQNKIDLQDIFNIDHKVVIHGPDNNKDLLSASMS